MIEGMINMIGSGGGASWRMGAQHVGTKPVTYNFAMPYSYGAPSGDVGRTSGQYAGGSYITDQMHSTEFTGLGKLMDNIGIFHEVALGDVSGLDDMFKKKGEGWQEAYNQWAGQQVVQGKKGIHIKPSKRGSFTAWCKKQGYGGVTSECKAAGKRSDSTAIRKKATFADNAGKWNKAEDGMEIPPSKQSVMPHPDDELTFPMGKGSRRSYTLAVPGGTYETKRRAWPILEDDIEKIIKSNEKFYPNIRTHKNELGNAKYKGLMEFIEGAVSLPGAMLPGALLTRAFTPFTLLSLRGDTRVQRDESGKYLTGKEIQHNKLKEDLNQKHSSLQWEPPQMERGGVIGVQPIQGPSHEAGGVDMKLNGKLVETEGGELLLEMADGSKVVLNKEQQERLRKGEKLENIIKELPKYQGQAQYGTDIPPSYMIAGFENPDWYGGFSPQPRTGMPKSAFTENRRVISGRSKPTRLTLSGYEPVIEDPVIDMSIDSPHSDYYLTDPHVNIALSNQVPDKYVPGVGKEPPGSTVSPKMTPTSTLGSTPVRTANFDVTGIVPQNLNRGRGTVPYRELDISRIPTLGITSDKNILESKIPSVSSTRRGTSYAHSIQEIPINHSYPDKLELRDSYSNLKGVEGSQEDDFFDQYNKNLLSSTISSAGSNLAQGLGAAVDMIKNKRKGRLPRTQPIGYAPVSPLLESPRPYLEALNTQMGSRMRMSREAGMMPAEMAMSATMYPEAISKVQGGVSDTNRQRILGAASINAENALKTSMVNAELRQRDNAMRLQEDQLRMSADARSRDAINKAMVSTSGLFGQYSQNKLTSDIMRSMHGSGNTAYLLSSMGMPGETRGGGYYSGYDDREVFDPTTGQYVKMYR